MFNKPKKFFFFFLGGGGAAVFPQRVVETLFFEDYGARDISNI